MKKNKRVLILGGGISALSLAYYIKEKADLVLIEKKPILGGVIANSNAGDFFFERGPRTFHSAKSSELIALIRALSLESEVIFSSRDAQRRFVYKGGQLQRIDGFSKELFFLLLAFFKEWRVPAYREDETIYQFCLRRLSKRVAEAFFDPLAIGMFGGDIRSLSIASCFPVLKQFEVAHGSLLKGFLLREKTKKQKGALFSLQKGVSSLVEKISLYAGCEMHLNEEILSFEKQGSGFITKTNKAVYESDIVVSALPCSALASLFLPQDREISAILHGIPSLSVDLVQAGFSKKVLPTTGFGYLVPTAEKEDLMGVIFDSEVFPQQNSLPEETRLTLLFRQSRSEIDVKNKAIEVLQRHLQIRQFPDKIESFFLEQALPQYHVGHGKKIKELEEKIRAFSPYFYLTGNFLEGVSVNDCIRRSCKVSSLIMGF